MVCAPVVFTPYFNCRSLKLQTGSGSRDRPCGCSGAGSPLGVVPRRGVGREGGGRYGGVYDSSYGIPPSDGWRKSTLWSSGGIR